MASTKKATLPTKRVVKGHRRPRAKAEAHRHSIEKKTKRCGKRRKRLSTEWVQRRRITKRLNFLFEGKLDLPFSFNLKRMKLIMRQAEKKKLTIL